MSLCQHSGCFHTPFINIIYSHIHTATEWNLMTAIHLHDSFESDLLIYRSTAAALQLIKYFDVI